jgi:hypothetical protein
MSAARVTNSACNYGTSTHLPTMCKRSQHQSCTTAATPAVVPAIFVDQDGIIHEHLACFVACTTRLGVNLCLMLSSTGKPQMRGAVEGVSRLFPAAPDVLRWVAYENSSAWLAPGVFSSSIAGVRAQNPTLKSPVGMPVTLWLMA